MRHYNYKKEFLGEFMRERGITSAQLKKVLGLESQDKIDMWAGRRPLPETRSPKEDRGWLPLKHILRICNHYDLPLASFIENAEEPPLRRSRRQAKPDLPADSRQVIDALRMTIESQKETIAAQQQAIESQRQTIELLSRQHGRSVAGESDAVFPPA